MKPKRVALSLVSVLAVSLAGCATEQEQRGLIDATALEMIPADEVEPVEIIRARPGRSESASALR